MADQSLFNAARRWADVPKLDPETERAAAEATVAFLKAVEAEVTGHLGKVETEGKDAEELGRRIGFTGQDLENFIATVARYNELCEKGVDEDFAKEPVLLRPLNGEHIFAYGAEKSFGSMLVTTGGLLTDDNSQVLGEDFEPIPGLFAAGNNCGGRFGFQYSTSIPGESLGLANTQGMLVGRYVAQL